MQICCFNPKYFNHTESKLSNFASKKLMGYIYFCIFGNHSNLTVINIKYGNCI
jgi:hypothetical protein